MTSRRFSPPRGAIAPFAAMVMLAACEGRQSVLNPTGEDALNLLALARVMFIGAVVLWLLVGALFVYVTRINPRPMSRRLAEALIVGGGVVFPVILLGALLAYSLPLMSAQRQPGDTALQVRVTAEQWWWRVEYVTDDGQVVVSANELRLPVGQRTGLILNAKNVIHSFWVPALGGKTDMIPGRETFMSLRPTEPGVYRGQCTEFCGASHALMAFETVAMAPEAFADWLRDEARDALPPTTAQAQNGADIFLREGCGACHTVRGTPAIGKVGPDLTHVGNRLSLGAGILGTETQDFARWIAHTDTLKPEVAMPAYDHLPPEDLSALATWLEALE